MAQIAKSNRVIGECWRVLAEAKPFEPSRDVIRHSTHSGSVMKVALRVS
jgi:hypothetical protein